MADSYNFVHCAHKVWRITKEKGPSETFQWTLQDKNLAFYHFIKKKKGDMPGYGGKWVFGQKYYRNEFLQKRCLNRLCDARNFERAVCRSLFDLGAYQHVLLRFMGQTGSSPTHTPIRAGTTQPSPRVYRGRNSFAHWVNMKEIPAVSRAWMKEARNAMTMPPRRRFRCGAWQTGGQ